MRGLVIAARRRRYEVRLDGGETIDCVLKGRNMTLACGDRVDVSRIHGGGAIDRVEPRTTLFYRSDAFKEKLIAANVTQIVGVVAPDIGVDEELVNRWTIAAEAQGCRFVLVANKRDHPDFAQLAARVEPFARLGYPVVELSARLDATPILPRLVGERSVLIGQSGMGKSTLLNAVAPHAKAKTAEVSEALATGRHTTSQSTLYDLPGDAERGWIVDSPGLKVFGLGHVAPETIEHAFVEIRPLLGHCRFRDCRHDREPGCAVREAVARGEIAPHRLALMRQLISESVAAKPISK